MTPAVSEEMVERDEVERIAECIWQAEWKRAGNHGLRRVPWSEVAETDQERYRFVAREVAAAWNRRATPAARPSAVAVKALIDAAWKAGSSWEVGNPQSEERAALFDKLASALSTLAPSAAASERLFDQNHPMADGEERMTAAEDVLAWLVIEKCGCPDDTTITPKEASDTIAGMIDHLRKYEDAALAQPQGELRDALEAARFAIETTVACLNTWNGGRGGPADTDGILARIDAALAGRTAG